jgi:uncharacterized protein YjbJ (UPF0337 family)
LIEVPLSVQMKRLSSRCPTDPIALRADIECSTSSVSKERLMNKDQVKGRLDQAKGKIKEEAGDLIGNKKMENEGRLEKNVGQGRAKVGDVKEDVKDVLKKQR